MKTFSRSKADSVLLAEIERRLPRTRDGASIFPGMRVWLVELSGVESHFVTTINREKQVTLESLGIPEFRVQSDNCYSTRPAAKIALTELLRLHRKHPGWVAPPRSRGTS